VGNAHQLKVLMGNAHQLKVLMSNAHQLKVLMSNAHLTLLKIFQISFMITIAGEFRWQNS
jgi:hypothetical protein